MALTAYAQKAMGDHAIGKAAWSMPAAVYLALLADSPGEGGSLTSEFTGAGYARVSLTAKMSVFDSVTGIATNSTAAAFPAPTAVWGAPLYAAIVDAATAGNILYYVPIPNPTPINNGSPAPTFGVGAISIQITGSTLGMISSYLMKKLGDHSIGKAAFTMPTGVFLGLLSSDPTVAGSMGSEVGVGGYVRQALTAAMSAFDASSGVSTNTLAVAFPSPTADYPSVAYDFVADALSGGNLLFSNQLPSTLTIRNAGAAVTFPAGSINLAFA